MAGLSQGTIKQAPQSEAKEHGKSEETLAKEALVSALKFVEIAKSPEGDLSRESLAKWAGLLNVDDSETLRTFCETTLELLEEKQEREAQKT